MLHGREAERARIDLLVAGAIDARGSALVVHGEPGVGKTALLTDAIDRADAVAVLWTAGIESESPLPFAALHRLLRPVLGNLGRIPPVQARALRGALGEDEDRSGGDGSTDERFLVFAATLSLLAETAEKQPLICIIDDAHWLDAASAEALLFVARRLHADRLALLFAARDGEEHHFDALGVPELVVPGLDADAASALLAQHVGVEMGVAVRDELRIRTGGNPLALVELPTVLSEGQLAGRLRLPAQLPLTQGVERAFLDRCRRLPGDAQALLLAAAADDSGRLSIIRQTAARLGAGDGALDAAERSGLLHVDGDDVRLRHPLVRSAVYSAASASQRQRTHGVLAAVLTAAGDPDRGTWHAALATTGLDDAVAGDLDALAGRATRRGGHEAASRAAERAAELSCSAGARAQRLFAAASSAWLAGDGARARTLADGAREATDDPLLRADVDWLRGRIEWHIGSPQTGRRIVLSAARDVAVLDSARALEMAMLATALATWSWDIPADEDVNFSGAAEESAPARLRCFAALLRGHRYFLRREMAGAAAAWHDAFRIGQSLPPDPDLLGNLGVAALHLADREAIRWTYGGLLALARDGGSLTNAVWALSRLPSAQLADGDWSGAAASANEALVLARGVGQAPLTAMPLAWLGLLAAFRGESARPDPLAELEAMRADGPMGIVGAAAVDMTEWAEGVLAANASDTHGALHHLERIRHPTICRSAALDRLEVAQRAGRTDVVQQVVDELTAWAAQVGAAAPAAIAEHGRALLTHGDVAERHFQDALQLHQAAGRPFGQARTQLAYGEFLRRNRRRVDARSHLGAALQVFDDLRAEPWAERARQELRASGVTARKRNSTTTGDLTPQERQTALLVSSGLANREIAARLFLSPRTVEYHLSNAYQKLGVRSRGEMAQLDLS
ncbi:regulatory protein, luxR family [Geodermatophilus amargosae]|uniref:Regulatory protein, luxR family n=1 Tax=Geodermatophilus amargosae TaxID=1296565 RepID=A0A1I7BJ15_9ACTN|nr:LuxR family transcriptional regulator [Geodermatophilus amargosae]SFT87178.1 regulatory protein, luxR family [Geodermatophilus amargosae]